MFFKVISVFCNPLSPPQNQVLDALKLIFPKGYDRACDIQQALVNLSLPGVTINFPVLRGMSAQCSGLEIELVFVGNWLAVRDSIRSIIKEGEKWGYEELRGPLWIKPTDDSWQIHLIPSNHKSRNRERGVGIESQKMYFKGLDASNVVEFIRRLAKINSPNEGVQVLMRVAVESLPQANLQSIGDKTLRPCLEYTLDFYVKSGKSKELETLFQNAKPSLKAGLYRHLFKCEDLIKVEPKILWKLWKDWYSTTFKSDQISEIKSLMTLFKAGIQCDSGSELMPILRRILKVKDELLKKSCLKLLADAFEQNNCDKSCSWSDLIHAWATSESALNQPAESLSVVVSLYRHLFALDPIKTTQFYVDLLQVPAYNQQEVDGLLLVDFLKSLTLSPFLQQYACMLDSKDPAKTPGFYDYQAKFFMTPTGNDWNEFTLLKGVLLISGRLVPSTVEPLIEESRSYGYLGLTFSASLLEGVFKRVSSQQPGEIQGAVTLAVSFMKRLVDYVKGLVESSALVYPYAEGMFDPLLPYIDLMPVKIQEDWVSHYLGYTSCFFTSTNRYYTELVDTLYTQVCENTPSNSLPFHPHMAAIETRLRTFELSSIEGIALTILNQFPQAVEFTSFGMVLFYLNQACLDAPSQLIQEDFGYSRLRRAIIDISKRGQTQGTESDTLSSEEASFFSAYPREVYVLMGLKMAMDMQYTDQMDSMNKLYQVIGVFQNRTSFISTLPVMQRQWSSMCFQLFQQNFERYGDSVVLYNLSNLLSTQVFGFDCLAGPQKDQVKLITPLLPNLSKLEESVRSLSKFTKSWPKPADLVEPELDPRLLSDWAGFMVIESLTLALEGKSIESSSFWPIHRTLMSKIPDTDFFAGEQCRDWITQSTAYPIYIQWPLERKQRLFALFSDHQSQITYVSSGVKLLILDTLLKSDSDLSLNQKLIGYRDQLMGQVVGMMSDIKSQTLLMQQFFQMSVKGIQAAKRANAQNHKAYANCITAYIRGMIYSGVGMTYDQAETSVAQLMDLKKSQVSRNPLTLPILVAVRIALKRMEGDKSGKA